MKQMYSYIFVAAMMSSLTSSCTLQSLDAEEVLPHLRDVATFATVQALALTAAGQHKVAYYVFDVTPAGQGILPMATFTNNANVVVVFEGTQWELADTQTLRSRGIKGRSCSFRNGSYIETNQCEYDEWSEANVISGASLSPVSGRRPVPSMRPVSRQANGGGVTWVAIHIYLGAPRPPSPNTATRRYASLETGRMHGTRDAPTLTLAPDAQSDYFTALNKTNFRNLNLYIL